jgi:hypothetical protein
LLGFTQKSPASRSGTLRGQVITEHCFDGFLNNTRLVDRARAKKWRLCPKHAAADCTDMNADLDDEHDRLIQVDVHGHTSAIPHTLRIDAAARTADRWNDQYTRRKLTGFV